MRKVGNNMSEEKEYKTSDQRAKNIYWDAIRYVSRHGVDEKFLPSLIEWKNDCIKSLEARLKESEFSLEAERSYNKNLSDELKEAEKFRDIFQKNDAENSLRIVSLEQRLSQAEAELAELKRFTHCAYCGAEFPLDSVTAEQIGEHIHNCPKHPIAVYKARLSHLMDVAGKMAGALVGMTKGFAQHKDWEEAKLALASWQDAKEGR
jgi:RNA polymerase-binding transcription factor DksA